MIQLNRSIIWSAPQLTITAETCELRYFATTSLKNNVAEKNNVPKVNWTD